MSRSTITLPAAAECWDDAYAFIAERLSDCRCPEETANLIAIAAEEIFVNIASYAYGPDGGQVEIAVAPLQNPRRVTLSFRDAGKPYNPLLRPDPPLDLDADRRAVGGLGVYLVKKTMDGVSYEYDNGQNVLSMTKNYETGEI